MNRRLSSSNEDKVAQALSKCAAATKNIENQEELNNKVFDILSKELGDKPQLFKVACRVYNSCKSIHKLNSFTDDTRGDSFAIIDANALTERLNKQASINLRKAAAAPVTFSLNKKRSENNLIKTASAGRRQRNCIVQESSEMSDTETRNFITSLMADTEDLLVKTASAVKMLDHKQQNLIQDFVSCMSVEEPSLRKQAAAKLYANYGEIAEVLVNIFNEARPLQKVASDYKNMYIGTPRLPDTTVFNKFKEILNTNELIKEATTRHQQAIYSGLDLTKLVKTHKAALVKEAGNPIVEKLIGASMATDIARDLPDMLGFEEADEEKMRSKIYDVEFNNALKAQAMRNLVVRLTMNPTISKYTLPQIIDATNLAVQRIPINMRNVPVTAHYGLLQGDVISNLASGNVPSKADVDKVLNATTAFKNIRSDRGLVAENDFR